MELAFLEQLPHAKLLWIRVLIIQVNKLLFSCSVVSDSLQPYGRLARLPCPPPCPGACSNSCPLSDAIQPSHHPPPPSSPPALNLSQHQGLFQYAGIRWPKCWSFSFSISPSNEYSGWISFRMYLGCSIKQMLIMEMLMTTFGPPQGGSD